MSNSLRPALPLVALLVGCGGATPAPESFTGGSYTFGTCGVTVTTPEGAAPPTPGIDYLGTAPTPQLVHVDVSDDPAHGMAIVWRTMDETTRVTKVQYGTDGKTDTTVDGVQFGVDLGGGQKMRIHEAHLCGLQPDTVYSYRVGGTVGGKDAWSPVSTFRTAPDLAAQPDAEVVALVIGDTRDGVSTWGQSLQQAWGKATPDVILFSGDAVGSGLDQTQWDAWLGAGAQQLATTPLAFAHGNHEVNSLNFFTTFALPDDEQNYAFDFGALHLAVANDSPENAADLTGANATTLAQNLVSTKPWRAMMNHRAMYSSSAGPHPADVTAIRTAWYPIVDQAGIDLVLEGHDHDYERSKPLKAGQPVTSGGTTFVVVGSAGAPLYPAGTNSWTALSESTYSFVILKIRATRLEATAYRGDGSMLDTFTLTK